MTVKKYCDQLVQEFVSIPEERKLLLEKISQYIRAKREASMPVNLVYICTHNSRRSHFGQIWSLVAAHYYGLTDIHSFSGGTVSTAFHPNAIAALQRIGFEVKKATDGQNPIYHVFDGPNTEPIICFSKVYDHPQNPKTSFVAIMTCSEAEENCPFIPVVELRIGTTYEDPKAFDNTPNQNEMYDERCRQIARETFYVFSEV